jgi:hypothetical protein
VGVLTEQKVVWIGICEREDGRLNGLGWKSVIEVVLVEDCLSGKDGGDWSSKENPISWRRCRRSRLPILGLHSAQNRRDLCLLPADTPSAAVTTAEADSDISCRLC